MACRRGSVAPASARRCTIQLSRLQLVLHNLPHSSKHVDVLELMMGRSMLVGWAAAEWAFGLGCAARPRRHVVARCGRGRTGWQCGRLIGQGAKVPWWAVARWLWWGRVCDTGTIHGRWHGSVVAERRLHASLGSGSLVIWFHWLLAPNRFIGSGRHAHGGWSSSWCEVARPSLRSVQVV